MTLQQHRLEGGLERARITRRVEQRQVQRALAEMPLEIREFVAMCRQMQGLGLVIFQITRDELWQAHRRSGGSRRRGS